MDWLTDWMTDCGFLSFIPYSYCQCSPGWQNCYWWTDVTTFCAQVFYPDGQTEQITVTVTSARRLTTELWHGVKKCAAINKLANLEGHTREHNTQQTPVLCYDLVCNTKTIQAILWMIYGLFFLQIQVNNNTCTHVTHTHSHARVQLHSSALTRPELSQHRSWITHGVDGTEGSPAPKHWRCSATTFASWRTVKLEGKS